MFNAEPANITGNHGNFEAKLNEALKEGKSLVQIKDLLKNQNAFQENSVKNQTNQLTIN